MVRRLVATVREAEARNNQERLDELAGENRRIQEQLERLHETREHYRVLIAATRDKSIEVFADPQVRVCVICLPDTRTTEDFEKSVEWALAQVPHEFRNMMDEPGIRPELHSVYCLTKAEWRLYREHREAEAYLKLLESAVEEVVESHRSSPVSSQPAEDKPF